MHFKVDCRYLCKAHGWYMFKVKYNDNKNVTFYFESALGIINL